MANLEIVMDETTVELAVISGAQQSDIVAAVAVETAAREAADIAHAALNTGVHGVDASTVASAADVTTAITTHNALATAHGVASGFWAAAAGTGTLTVGTAGSVAGKIAISAALPNDSPFTMFTEHYPFNGTEETTFNIGYNILGELANTYRFWMGMESNYRATVSDYYCEWYITFDNATQTKNTRPLQTSINNQTQEAQNFYSAETHYFCGSDGLSENFMSFINGTPATIVLNGSTEIQHNTNNAVVLRQKNTTGTQVALFYLTNLNTLSISSGGVSNRSARGYRLPLWGIYKGCGFIRCNRRTCLPHQSDRRRKSDN